MASAAQLAELDQEHRRQQAQNAAALILALNATWEQVEPGNLARTGTAWLAEAIALIVSRRRRSGALTLDYARQIRELQIGLDPSFSLPTLPDPNLVQLRESLTYVGLKATAIDLAKIPGRRAARELGFDDPEQAESFRREDTERVQRENLSIDQMTAQAMQRARQRVGMAAVRHVNNGGRDATDAVVKTDRRALGYVRVTRDNPCWFCAMLASRGAVFREDSFAESDARFEGLGNHKTHDSCQCSLRAVYTRDAVEIPVASLRFGEIWKESGAKASGAAARRAFREAYLAAAQQQ